MGQHRIRLRGGWESQSIEEGSRCGTHRLTLPTQWAVEGPARLRLSRGFHRPLLDPNSHLRLVLEQVPGIQALRLNGQPLVRASTAQARYDIPLGDLPPWNQLVLEIDVPGPIHPPDLQPPAWGFIALVIQSAGTGEGD